MTRTTLSVSSTILLWSIVLATVFTGNATADVRAGFYQAGADYSGPPVEFLGGPYGSHFLNGTDEGFAHYTYAGIEERWPLIYWREDGSYWYYYEKGYPNYQWAVAKSHCGSQRVVWHRRPGVNGWFVFHHAYRTKLSYPARSERR